MVGSLCGLSEGMFDITAASLQVGQDLCAHLLEKSCDVTFPTAAGWKRQISSRTHFILKLHSDQTKESPPFCLRAQEQHSQ